MVAIGSFLGELQKDGSESHRMNIASEMKLPIARIGIELFVKLALTLPSR